MTLGNMREAAALTPIGS
jgi:uncharacterized membrane protein YgcG